MVTDHVCFQEAAKLASMAEMRSLTEEAMLACRPITSGAYRQVFPKTGPAFSGPSCRDERFHMQMAEGLGLES